MLKSDGNLVLVASCSLESEGVEKLIEIVNDLLIEAVQLGSFVRIRQKVDSAICVFFSKSCRIRARVETW
jgi:hypothetical protein